LSTVASEPALAAGVKRSVKANALGHRFSLARGERLQFLDDGWDNFERAVDLGVRREPREAEADGAVGDAVVDGHGAEDVGGFEAAGAACRAGGGANALLAEEKKNRLGFEAGEADVSGVGEALVGAAVHVCLGDSGEGFRWLPLVRGNDIYLCGADGGLVAVHGREGD